MLSYSGRRSQLKAFMIFIYNARKCILCNFGHNEVFFLVCSVPWACELITFHKRRKGYPLYGRYLFFTDLPRGPGVGVYLHAGGNLDVSGSSSGGENDGRAHGSSGGGLQRHDKGASAQRGDCPAPCLYAFAAVSATWARL